MTALTAHLEILRQDLRFTARTLAASRGFAIATILVTALGVGANTATFSVADFVLLRPLPFPDSEALVRICEGPRQGGGWGCNNQLSPANYRDVAAMSKSFASLGVFSRNSMNLVGVGEPIRVAGAALSREVLPLLGVAPLMGRVFAAAPGEADGPTVVLGYGLWQSHFGGNAGIIGTTLSLDNTPRVVIGVMPPHFRFPTDDVQLWVPLVLREATFASRSNTYLDGIARLAPGVTFEQARADLATIAARLAADYPDTNSDRGFSFFRMRDEMSPVYRTMLLALCGASLCLLVLTCANLANLLLARAASREREMAVRSALGAGRERLVRQMLTESVALTLLGGAAGVLLAVIAVPLLARLVPPSLPLAAQPTVDLRVFAFAAAFSALTALGCGLIPALRAGGVAGVSALREGARGGARRSRLRTTLVAIEVGLSVVLLVASGLLIRAVWRVQAVEPGFATDAVLTMKTALPRPRYDDPARREEFYRRVTSGVRSLPGVESAAYTSGLPMVLMGGITNIQFPGDTPAATRARTASLRIVTPQFFSTLRIPIRRGRDVSDADTRTSALVAVISESFAQKYWPGADPLGRTFDTRGQSRTIVGIVGDIRVRGLERTSEPQLYLPANQPPTQIGDLYQPKDLVIRSSRRDPTLAAAVREIVRHADPQQPISDVRMLADVVGDQTMTRRTQLRVLGALAVLALVLTAVGIHGLLAFTVTQRDREIGVRLALGANPSGVARMIMSEGVRVAVIGVIPGVVVAYLAARGMSSLLFGVRPEDPVTFATVAAICFMTAVAACAHSAWRASRIDPISALRSD